MFRPVRTNFEMGLKILTDFHSYDLYASRTHQRIIPLDMIETNHAKQASGRATRYSERGGWWIGDRLTKKCWFLI